MAKEKGHGTTVAIVAVLVLVIAAGLGGEKQPKPAETPKPTTQPTGVPDWRRTAKAQSEVKSMLRDPASAEFGDMRVSAAGGTPVVCGTVNSKNGFGGMGGSQRFISGAVTALEEQMASGEMDAAWNKMC